MLMLLMCMTLMCPNLMAGPPGEKRTILTSGEKVYTIKYQLGQSTVLYFGEQPQTVICGNKNYFNIEKIKGGITIQPLSNISTNLTVLSGGRRYLFYLTPSGRRKSDGFVEVRWVPKAATKPVRSKVEVDQSYKVNEIGSHLKLSPSLEFSVLNEKWLDNDGRQIFELRLKNSSRARISTGSIEVIAASKGKPIKKQVLVWEMQKLSKGQVTMGRLIVTEKVNGPMRILVGFKGKTTELVIGRKYR